MKKYIYREIGVFSIGLLGAGAWYLFNDGLKNADNYFLIVLGSLLLLISLRSHLNNKKGKKK